MCKLFMLTRATDLDRADTVKLLEKCIKIIASYDKDGFGYVVSGKDGVFGERYLGTSDCSLGLLKNCQPIPEKFQDIFKSAKGDSFYRYSPTDGALLAHGRMSTNTVVLENSHPHWNDEWALIHNGVVENEGPKYEMKSSCDSEHLLHHLTAGGLTAIETHITGYYAVGAINRKTRELLIFKDRTATLYGCYVTNLNSMAFATSKFHLEEIIKHMDWKSSEVWEVEDNVSFRFNHRGDYLEKKDINPRKKVYPVGNYRSRDHDDCYDYHDWKDRTWDSNLQKYVKREPKQLAMTEGKKAKDWLDNFLDNDAPDKETCDAVDGLVTIKTRYGKIVSYKAFCRMPLKIQALCTVTDKSTGSDIPVDHFEFDLLDKGSIRA